MGPGSSDDVPIPFDRCAAPIEPVNVICAKWGSKFDATYVNRLASMVSRHLSLPHRFVCFTDDTTGLEESVEAHPLPELRMPSAVPERGWCKLATFRTESAGLEGPTLFLDLDVVVVDSLDPLFSHPGRFCIIRDYRPFRRAGYVGNSSVYRFVAGEWQEIPDRFEEEQAEIRARFRNEQEYLSHFVHRRGALTHWPREWCPSFKHDCMWKGPLGLFLTPRIPPGARVVVFHGRPNPGEAIEGRSGSWRRALRPTPWVAQHWK